MKAFQKSFKEILRYPSAIAGIIIIFLLVVVAIYAVTAIPYSEAVRLWRGGEDVWYQNPKTAPPAWTNWFTSQKLPATLTLDSVDADDDERITKTHELNSDGSADIIATYTFDFPYDTFPQEMSLYFETTFEEKSPFVDIKWITPDEREVRIASFGVDKTQAYYFSQDTKLERRLGKVSPEIGLFAVPDSDPPQVLKGTYQLQVEGLAFEEASTRVKDSRLL